MTLERLAGQFNLLEELPEQLTVEVSHVLSLSERIHRTR